MTWFQPYSSSEATRISCLQDFTLRYSISLEGSKFFTMALAWSANFEICSEYWKWKIYSIDTAKVIRKYSVHFVKSHFHLNVLGTPLKQEFP